MVWKLVFFWGGAEIVKVWFGLHTPGQSKAQKVISRNEITMTTICSEGLTY